VSYPELGPGFGEPEMDPATVPLIPGAAHEAEPDQAGELKGNGGRGDLETASELPHGQGLPGVEMLEEPGQVGAQPGAAFRLADFAAAAGGEDHRVGGENGPGRGVEHEEEYIV
jgi:hypothetical protein